MAVQAGILDPMPVARIAAFRQGLPAALDREVAGAMRAMGEGKSLDDGSVAAIRAALEGLAAVVNPKQPET
jgi:F-type H+-transporting ATPase subunit alpha